jgi:hemolysin activation/secretion protein
VKITFVSKSHLLALLAGAFSATLHAAPPVPDAGQLLQQQPKAPVPSAAPQAPAASSPVPEGKPEKAGPSVLVKGFRIVGATLISEQELQTQLTEHTGKTYSFEQLQIIALRLIGYYAEQGYLARVFLAPQDFNDGIVTFTVVEGKLGALKLDDKIDVSRIDAARVQRFLAARLTPGAPLSMSAVGEALNILNEQPGIEARASLKPGSGEGAVDLLINATATPPTTYNTQINNHGARGTGELQLTGSITLNNPTGNFDAASLLLNASEGNTYLHAGYSLAVGDNGLRVGVNASALDYRITQSDFTALKANGDASQIALTASYPLARRTDFSLSLEGSVEGKRLVDRTVAGETSNRSVTVTHLGINGYTVGGALGSAVGSFGAGVSFGNTDQRNATALATDSTTRQVQGGFSKFSYNLGYLRPLPRDWRFNATLNGQFAGKNLDSSERINFGGINGVRAYPTGEATADEGWLLRIDLAKPFNDSLLTHVFLDAAGAKLNHQTWNNWNAANAGQSNTYQIAGVGAGLDWRISRDVLVSASVASPLGNNPGADTLGKNVDGKGQSTRVWLGLNARF